MPLALPPTAVASARGTGAGVAVDLRGEHHWLVLTNPRSFVPLDGFRRCGPGRFALGRALPFAPLGPFLRPARFGIQGLERLKPQL